MMNPFILSVLFGAEARERTLWDVVRKRRAAGPMQDEAPGPEPSPEPQPVVAAGPVDQPAQTEPLQIEPLQTEPVEDPTEADPAPVGQMAEVIGVVPSTKLVDDPEKALGVDPLQIATLDQATFDIPIDDNQEVKRWLNYFTGNGRARFAIWLERSTRYRAMMEHELNAGGLPEDLIYLSMIESGYSPNAYSRAAAVGLWQFMSATGRENGLRIDSAIDERRDPYASTKAAVAFLQHLYAIYGDWRLAWAAYNGGPGRMSRAIKATGSRDFWTIAKTDHIRPETKNYVPKLMAAAIIGKNPEKYGFTDLDYAPPLDLKGTELTSAYDLEVLAKCAGLSVDQLKRHNPHLRQSTTPGDRFLVYVPRDKKQAFAKAAADVPTKQRIRSQEHRVAKGDSLGTIADRYDTSVASIQQVNGISNANHIRVGQTLIIPTDVAPPKTAKKSWTTYTVRRGDTLSGIAQKTSCSVDELKSWNDLKRTTIYPGQKLKVRQS